MLKSPGHERQYGSMMSPNLKWVQITWCHVKSTVTIPRESILPSLQTQHIAPCPMPISLHQPVEQWLLHCLASSTPTVTRRWRRAAGHPPRAPPLTRPRRRRRRRRRAAARARWRRAPRAQTWLWRRGRGRGEGLRASAWGKPREGTWLLGVHKTGKEVDRPAFSKLSILICYNACLSDRHPECRGFQLGS